MSQVVDEQGNQWHNEPARRKRLNMGVNGAHCCMPFQCDTCWLWNLEKRSPGPKDEFLMKCIRRANLDAMAGKAVSTIRGHKNQTLEMIRIDEHANKTPSLQPRGPFPESDPIGMGLFCDILIKSVIARGRISPHVQAETLRKLRATFAKNWDSSPAGVAEKASFGRGTGRVRATECPSQSEYFLDAWRGLESRMGHESKANHATTIGVIVMLLTYVARDAEAAETEEEANQLWKFGAFLCMCTAGSLRGYEGFYADLAGLDRHIDTGKDGVVPPGRINKNTVLSENECENLPHVVIPLIGKFKGDHFVDHHLINVASESMSGLKTRWWLEKLLKVAQSEGRTQGPAFATPQGRLIPSSEFDALFRQYLSEIQASTDLIDDKDVVEEKFGISRTPRRTAVSRAKRAGFREEVDEMNRWRTVENSKGRKAKVSMQMLYAEAVQMMPTTWRVSYAL